jgi:selenocysteine lyase/cysteine desulfurase
VSTLQPGEVIVLTELEYHANYLPWLELARERGLRITRIPLTTRESAGPGSARHA